MNLKRMTANPLPPDTSLYSLIEIFFVCATFITVCWKWIDSYFKSLKESKQEFIQSVVVATVRATLESELKGVKENISKLFEYREDDRTHSDSQFKELLREIKK